MNHTSLSTLLIAVARERTTTGVVEALARGLADLDGVALARVWRSSSAERSLHLAASAGECAELAAGDASEAERAGWWAHAGVEHVHRLPLVSAGEDVGLVALFGRSAMSASGQELLAIVANQAAAALANAAAFEALQQQNQELRETSRDLFDEAPIAYVHEGLDSRFIRANKAAKRMLGVASDHIVGRLGSSFVADTPENQQRLRGALHAVGRGTEASEIVLELRREDTGKPVWVQWSSKPARNGGYTRTMMVDITDRVLIAQTKAALEFSLESGQVGDWDLDLIQNTSRRSLRHDQCFGYDAPVSEEDWGLDAFERHIHPEDRERVLGSMKHALAELRDWSAEFRVVWADDTIHWLVARGRIYGMHEGVPSRMLGIVMDITDRKRAEETLRGTKAALDFALESARVGDWDLDLRNDTSRRSLRHDECFGYKEPIPEAEWGIEAFARHIHPDDRARVADGLRRAAGELVEWGDEFRVIWADGSIHWLVTRGSIYRTVEGKPTRMLGIVMDITDRKRVEEALVASEELARGQVQALTSTLEELAEESSPHRLVEHVLRTIMAQLGGQGSVLWRRDDDGESMVLAFKTGAFGSSLEVIERTSPFPVREGLLTIGALTVLVVPMSFAGRIAGAVGIVVAAPRVFRPSELELARALANQAMLAMQVTRLSAQALSSAVVMERNRIAREVHDTLAQGFTGVIVQLEASADARSNGLAKEADEHVGRASDLARASLREARRSLRALRPLELEAMDLTDALDLLTRKMTTGTNITAKLDTEGIPIKLPPEWDGNLVRIVQEVLANVLRHAHASRLDARISYTASEVRLEIRDDGRGFDTMSKSDGFGLLGIRERVEEMGGTSSVESSPREGTRIAIALPYPAELLR